MVAQKSEPEPEKVNIEIVSKKGALGKYRLNDVRVTFKKDQFGNPEYAFYNDKQILFITQGFPQKYGRNSVAFDSVAESYDHIKDFEFDLEAELKELTINDVPVRFWDIQHIWLKKKVEHATSSIVIDGLNESADSKPDKTDDILAFIKKAGYVQTSELLSKFDSVSVSETLKYLIDKKIVENKNGFIKYTAQQEL